MLHIFKKNSIELLVILFVIIEYASTSKHNNFLSDPASVSQEETSSKSNIESATSNLHHAKRMFYAGNNKDNRNGENKNNEQLARECGKGRIIRQGPKLWDHWGNWSSCSVTCGVGKLTRWKHCIGGSCEAGEKRAQLKTCTLAAC